MLSSMVKEHQSKQVARKEEQGLYMINSVLIIILCSYNFQLIVHCYYITSNFFKTLYTTHFRGKEHEKNKIKSQKPILFLNTSFRSFTLSV